MQKALFLDRDGVVNVDKNYLYKIEEFEFCEGIFELLSVFQSLGYILIVVTNQSGIARGYYNDKDFQKLTKWMVDEFQKKGVQISKVYHCPHLPEESCSCRKPKTGMLDAAKKEFDIDMENSWLIGDKASDIEAGKKAGVRNTVFVNNLTCKEAKYSVKTLLDIIRLIN